MAASSRPDATAIVLSLMCLVHCLVLPLAIALIPAATHFLDLPEEVHAMIFFVAVPISAMAVLMGQKRHGLWLPAIIAAMGLILIGTGAFGGLSLLLETGISVVGSLLLLVAHAVNMGANPIQDGNKLPDHQV